MFTINDDLSIYVTRGDVAFFTVGAEQDGVAYKFQPNDIVRIKVTSKKDAETVLMQKSFVVEEETERVEIYLTGDDTKFGDVVSKATDYWYEIELNPYTNPQTIIGFDEDGAKIFKLFPEGDDVEYVEEKDIPLVDSELSLTSERPIQNQAVARALILYDERVEEAKNTINTTAEEAEQRLSETAKSTKTEVDSYVSGAIRRVEVAEEEALENVQESTESAAGFAKSAEASAKIAKDQADRASAIVIGDFATNGRVDAIENGTTQVGDAKKLGGKSAEEYAEVADLANYLPLSGGEINSTSANPLWVNATGHPQCAIVYGGMNGALGSLGFRATDVPSIFTVNGVCDLLHTGNMANHVLTKSGGTLNGQLELNANNANTSIIPYEKNTIIRNVIDASNYTDVNIADGVANLTKYSNGSVVTSGTLLHTGNIGSQIAGRAYELHGNDTGNTLATLNTVGARMDGPITLDKVGSLPAVDNSNAILTVHRHVGDYYSQLGFSSNGGLYYRATTYTPMTFSTPWAEILHTSNSAKVVVSSTPLTSEGSVRVW